MRGKTSGGCNTGAGIYVMELLPCAENLWRLQYTSVGNYATAVMPGKNLWRL